MSSPITQEVGVAYELSSTGGVAKTGNGTLAGIFISSAGSTPTVTVYDGATAGDTSTPLIPTFTPAAATYYNFKVMFQKGLNIVLGGSITGAAMYI